MDDKKSTFGYIFMMAKLVVLWKSFKKTLTTSSTMEVEYVACYEATCHAIWLWKFISALGVINSISRSLKLFCDNSIVIFVTPQNQGVSMITRQPAEYSWTSGNPTPLMKIGQSLLCTGSSTQNITCPNDFTTTTLGPHTNKMSKNDHLDHT